MIAKFKIKLIFPLRSSNCVVIGGDILEGEVREGMRIVIDNKHIPISGVEIIDRKEGALVGLVMKYKNDKERNEVETIFKNVLLVTITKP